MRFLTFFFAEFIKTSPPASASRSYGVMAITVDFESTNPSSSLGRTSLFFPDQILSNPAALSNSLFLFRFDFFSTLVRHFMAT